MRKITVIAQVALFASCILQNSPCTQTNQNQSVSNYKEISSTPLQHSAGLRGYKLGEKINLVDRTITVFGFQPYSEASMKDFYGTSQGIAMDVLIENTSGTPFRLNPLHFTVQDSKGRALTFYDVTPGGKSPALKPEEVAPGQKIRAFVTYADNKKPAVIYYKPLEGQMAKIVVE